MYISHHDRGQMLFFKTMEEWHWRWFREPHSLTTGSECKWLEAEKFQDSPAWCVGGKALTEVCSMGCVYWSYEVRPHRRAMDRGTQPGRAAGVGPSREPQRRQDRTQAGSHCCGAVPANHGGHVYTPLGLERRAPRQRLFSSLKGSWNLHHWVFNVLGTGHSLL